MKLRGSRTLLPRVFRQNRFEITNVSSEHSVFLFLSNLKDIFLLFSPSRRKRLIRAHVSAISRTKRRIVVCAFSVGDSYELCRDAIISHTRAGKRRARGDRDVGAIPFPGDEHRLRAQAAPTCLLGVTVLPKGLPGLSRRTHSRRALY